MNKFLTIGRLVADIEVKLTTEGVSVCRFTLAVKRPRVKDKTDFINFVAWRNNAEYLGRYAKKGDAIVVEGVLTSRKYQDPKSGDNRTAFEVVCDEVNFAPTNSKETREPQNYTAPLLGMEDLPDESDLPF